ncbi:MAG: enoyl-CoA hydratase/isomerase family protein [Desulfurococcales archaeon]|nr:enoyl-CoA hydratase/isomerase family protein [Desulfurococcales archaeon]
MEDGRVYLRSENSVGWIIIDRPRKRNAMTSRMWTALADYVLDACSRSDTAVVALRGVGGAFSAGDDIGEMLSISTPGEADRFFERVARAFEAVSSCPKITAALVEGPAAGGGAEMLLLIDYVVAVEGSIIGYPEIHIGLIPPILLTWGPKILGARTARKLALTGSYLQAREALRLGIVDEVVDTPSEGKKRIMEISLAAAGLPRKAVSAIKSLLPKPAPSEIHSALQTLKLLVLSDEAKKRMREFLEKRRRHEN